jgi:hypothetical protein
MFYIYFKSRVIGKHGKKDIGGHWESPQKLVFKVMKDAGKDIMGARNIYVLVHENEILDSKINGSGNDFMDNLNMIMDYQCLVTNYF